jgi:hypothetical protein
MTDRTTTKLQIAILRDLSVRFVMVSPRALERDMIQRGLLRQDGNAYCIAPFGLRVLADALEAGAVEDGLTMLARQKEATHD